MWLSRSLHLELWLSRLFHYISSGGGGGGRRRVLLTPFLLERAFIIFLQRDGT